jgi:hypothetical protein
MAAGLFDRVGEALGQPSAYANRDPATVRYKHRRPPDIETDHRTPDLNRLCHDKSRGVMEAWKQERIGLAHRCSHRLPRALPVELHALLNTQLVRTLYQAGSLPAISVELESPLSPKLRKRSQRQVWTLPSL